MKTKKAFSLIELSIVLVIIAILISASMPIATSVINNYKNRITKERIQAIYQALGNFTASYQRLPCPASITLTKSNANYGMEIDCGTLPYYSGQFNPIPAPNSGVWQNTWSPNLIYGMIPVAALGLSKDMAEDGFGNKLAYSVIRGFTNLSTFGGNDPSTYAYNSYTNSTYNSTNCDRIKIHERIGSTIREVTMKDPAATNGGTSCPSTTLNEQAMFVIISHGANQYGAFPANLTSQNIASFSSSNFPASNSDEGWNMLRIDNMGSSYAGPNGYFYNYGTVGAENWYPFVANSSQDGFDDIVFYKTRNQFVSDFGLSNLLSCDYQGTQTITYGSSYNFAWNELGTPSWEATKYKGTKPSTGAQDCPTNYRKGATQPRKRCGNFGIWQNNIADPCKS